jgi:hypothetical protein
MNEGKTVTNDEAGLREMERESGGQTDGTKDIQVGHSIVVIHVPFGNSHIRPAERRPALRVAPGSDIPNSKVIDPAVAYRVGMGDRENSEAQVVGTRKSRNISHWIEKIARERNRLTIICKEETACDFGPRRSQVVKIGHKLIFAKVTRRRKVRETLTGEWFGGIHGLRCPNQKCSIGQFEIQQCESNGIDIRPIWIYCNTPRAPVIPPNSFPSAAGVLSFVSGGELSVAVHAILDWPAAWALIWRVP